jgi:hypothetical protein
MFDLPLSICDSRCAPYFPICIPDYARYYLLGAKFVPLSRFGL